MTDTEETPMTAPAPLLDTHPYPLPGEPSGQRHCGWCGASDMTAVLQVARWDTTAGGPLVRCKSIGDCMSRYLVREAARAAEREAAARAEAERSAAVAAAAVQGAARAREETAPEAPATAGEAPAEAGEPASVAAKRAPRTRAERVAAAPKKPAPA